jgi:hypothetical protein
LYRIRIRQNASQFNIKRFETNWEPILTEGVDEGREIRACAKAAMLTNRDKTLKKDVVSDYVRSSSGCYRDGSGLSEGVGYRHRLNASQTTEAWLKNADGTLRSTKMHARPYIY